MIILALAEVEGFADAATIAKALSVDQSFVRAHARRLEKLAHIESAKRGEVVGWTLTADAVAKLATLLSVHPD